MKRFLNYMSLTLALILASCSMSPVAAQTVGLHLASVHSKSGYNNVNPGVYVNLDGWTVGTYYNSERRQSYYAGYTLDRDFGPVRASLTLGGITGYDGGPLPLVVPSLAVRDALLGGYWRVSYAAKVYKHGAHALHLSHEWTFN